MSVKIYLNSKSKASLERDENAARLIDTWHINYRVRHRLTGHNACLLQISTKLRRQPCIHIYIM